VLLYLEATRDSLHDHGAGEAFNEEVRSVKPSLLIIDIEGGEMELVPHMDLTGIRAIVIELHERVTGPEGAQTVRQSLMARGFRLEDIGDSEHCLFLR
jgi:hypothetical protein